jgi:arsenate reductase (thioredoxin)
MTRVLFVCLHNAGRSQMSEALFTRAADGRHEARSAGTEPAQRVHPQVVEAMRERGVDPSDRRPRKLEHADAEWADVVVTMGRPGLVDGRARRRPSGAWSRRCCLASTFAGCV